MAAAIPPRRQPQPWPRHRPCRQRAAPAALAAASRLPHLGAELLRRALGKAPYFSDFFHFTFGSINHPLLAAISIFRPCSALPVLSSQPGSNLLCYPQTQVTRLTFFLRHIYCFQGLSFPKLLQTDICLFEVSSVSSAKPENRYSSRRFGSPRRQVQAGSKPGSVPCSHFQCPQTVPARTALLAAVGKG